VIWIDVAVEVVRCGAVWCGVVKGKGDEQTECEMLSVCEE